MPTLSELVASHQNAILYDGECPVCANYVSFLHFKEDVGEVTLIDCRSHLDIVEAARNEGYDLNDGMILLLAGNLYYGDKAVQKIAQSSEKKGLFNRLQRALFRSDTTAKLLYPIMVVGRKLLLKLLGRNKI